MKIIKVVIFSFFLVGICQPAQAQFWKKLKKKAQEKISKTEDKIIENLDKRTDKTIDDTIDGKEEKKIVQSTVIPKFTGGSGILKLYNHGYEYVTKDIAVSVYGNFTKENLSTSQKSYNEDKVIIPVDAYPKGYALAFNGAGYLNTKEGQIIIHHADSTKIVFSLKGTWNTLDGNKAVKGSFVNLNVSEIIDKRKQSNTSSNNIKTTIKTNNSNNNSIVTQNKVEEKIDLPSTYSFDKSLEIEMTTNNSEAIKMELLFGDNKDIYAMLLSDASNGQGSVYNVITPNKVTMFMDMPGMKMKKSIPASQINDTNYADKMPKNADSLQKTGATKSILGYNCEEYKYENDGGYVSVWATKDFPVKKTNISMLGMAENNMIDGFILELNMKSGNETSKVQVIKYNPNKKVSINTTAYKSMGF